MSTLSHVLHFFIQFRLSLEHGTVLVATFGNHWRAESWHWESGGGGIGPSSSASREGVGKSAHFRGTLTYAERGTVRVCHAQSLAASIMDRTVHSEIHPSLPRSAAKGVQGPLCMGAPLPAATPATS